MRPGRRAVARPRLGSRGQTVLRLRGSNAAGPYVMPGRFWIIAFALAACAGPAAATPPDMVEIRDELFGVGPGEILVLRTVTDNLGSHVNSLSGTALVAIDAATGAETLWPVGRHRLQPADPVMPGETPLAILAEPLEDARDPFAILAARGAMPAGAAARLAEEAALAVELGPEGALVRHADGARFRLPAERLSAGLADAAARIAALAPPYPRMGGLSLSDLLDGVAFAPEGCTLAQPLRLRFPAELPPIQLARVSCGTADDDVRISLLRVIPPAP